MKIRPARLEDLEVIVDYNLRLAMESENLALDQGTVRAGVEALLRDATKGYYLVAEDEPDGAVLGQLMITYEWSDWRNGLIWWIQSVYVRGASRGQGVFKALFDHVSAAARKDQGVRALRLYMDRDNDKARRAYAKAGMHETHYLVFEMGV